MSKPSLFILALAVPFQVLACAQAPSSPASQTLVTEIPADSRFQVSTLISISDDGLPSDKAKKASGGVAMATEKIEIAVEKVERARMIPPSSGGDGVMEEISVSDDGLPAEKKKSSAAKGGGRTIGAGQVIEIIK